MAHHMPGIPEMTPAHVEAMQPFVERVLREARAEAVRIGIHEQAGAVTLATMIAGRSMAELTGDGVPAGVIEFGARMMGNAVYQSVLVEHEAIYNGGPRE